LRRWIERIGRYIDTQLVTLADRQPPHALQNALGGNPRQINAAAAAKGAAAKIEREVIFYKNLATTSR
jgi:hypothetical protein